MQHRRSKKKFLVLAPLVLLAGCFVFLLLKEVPAPSERVEKPLETAKFIKPKP